MLQIRRRYKDVGDFRSVEGLGMIGDGSVDELDAKSKWGNGVSASRMAKKGKVRLWKCRGSMR